MQQPTCSNIRIRSTQDAHKIFYAVQKGMLPMVTRRLDANERNALTTGCVYAWEERCSQNEITGLGIERFTEGRRWSPSRVRDEFLFYYEKYQPSTENGNTTADVQPPRHWDPMVKQTYSVWVDTDKGRRKWHLTAYFTQTTVDDLGTIDNIPGLKDLEVPPGLYKTTRVNKKRNKPDGENSAVQSDQSQKSSSVPRTYAPFSPLYNPYPSTSPQATAPDAVVMHDPYHQPNSRDNSPSYMSSSPVDRRPSFSHAPEPFLPMPYEEHTYSTQFPQHHPDLASRGDTYAPVPAAPELASNALTASPPAQFYHHSSRYAVPSPASTWSNAGNGILSQESLLVGGNHHHAHHPTRSSNYHAHTSSPAASYSPYALMADAQPDPYNNYSQEAYTTSEGSRADGGGLAVYGPHEDSPPPAAFLTAGPSSFDLLVRIPDHDERRGQMGPDRDLASIQALTRRHPYRRDPLDDQTLRMLPS